MIKKVATTQVYKEFSEFGGKMTAIAILTLLSFILSIVGAFFWVVGFIALGLQLVIIIIFLLVLGNIKRAGKSLNNQNLLDFTPKFLWGTIIRFVGQVFWSIGWYFNWIILLVLVLIGIGLIIIGSILRYKAWGGLETFFQTNMQLFPPKLANNGRSGSKICKISTILDMTIILSFIGEILRIIGYFTLGPLKDLVGAPAQQAYQPAAPVPSPAVMSSAQTANYCPNCGSSLSAGARFCAECGSDIS